MKKVELNPTAKIAIKKNVLKHYQVDGKTSVFLPKDSEFEIELFNPLSHIIMCSIKLNGNEESEGLVLYPGERVFLERYLSTDKKFKFKTYEVDKNNKEVDNAIKFNGLIEIAFFNEVVWNYNIIYTNYGGSWGNPYNGIVNTSGKFTAGDDVYIYTSSSYGNITNINPTEYILTSASAEIPEKKETGIIEKGEQSNQKLSYVNKNFEYTPFHKEIIQILPESEKVSTSSDIKYKKYCSNCGKKVNYNDNFCSSCGNKLN